MNCIILSESKTDDLKRQISIFLARLEEIKPSITNPESALIGEIEKIEKRFAREAFDKELERFSIIKDSHILHSLLSVQGGDRKIIDLLSK